ncbi:hypothetical protein [Streptomyces sp. NPDC050988]|uniref:hypothetical protein n=1 Tax=Streptomyces sp. NPDC050988 TaxID=3365637 RepID=UPI0037967BD6
MILNARSAPATGIIDTAAAAGQGFGLVGTPDVPGPSVDAIPTRYGHTTFRSRLEADWAATLDGNGIQREYERLRPAKRRPDRLMANGIRPGTCTRPQVADRDCHRDAADRGR